MRPAIPLLALLLCIGCTSYVPIHFSNGADRVVKLETPEATIYMEYIANRYGNNVFDLEVINHSSNPIYFNPHEIGFESSAKPFPPESEFGNGSSENVIFTPKQFVLDPQLVVSLYRQKEKQRAVLSAVVAVAYVGLMVYSSSQSKNYSKVSSENYATRALNREAMLLAGQLATNIAAKSAVQAQAESQRLPYEIFSEGEIGASGSKRGKVFIRSQDCGRFIRMGLPFGTNFYMFYFKQ